MSSFVPDLGVQLLREGARLPRRMSAGAAGLDLFAAPASGELLVIPSGARALVDTGLVLRIPPGFEGQVRPRSGLALRNGVTVLNAPGTIDADYRGELRVLLVNLGDAPFEVRPGDRVAQLVIAPVTAVEVRELAAIAEDTERGAGGFGSTGRGGEGG